MASDSDFNKIPEQMALDLRNWDVSAKADLDRPLDLRADARAPRRGEFYEAAPAYVHDPILAPFRNDSSELLSELSEDSAHDHLPTAVSVIIAAVAFGCIVWAILRQILSLHS